MPSKAVSKFTDNLIKGLLPEEKRYNVSCQGLVLRVSPSGNKTWTHVYRFDGKPGHRYTIGKYPHISLSQANEVVLANLKLLAVGINPNDQKKADAKEKELSLTVRQLYNRYMNEFIRPRLAVRSIADYEKEITKHILGIWGELPVKSITRLDGIELLKSMVNKGRIAEEGRVRAYLSGMWKFALNHQIIDSMPFSSMPKVYAPLSVKNSKPKKNGKRFLTNDEIYYFWHNAQKNCEPQVAACLMLMLLLGRRGADVRHMLKSEIDLEAKIWHMTPAKVREEKKEDYIPIMMPLPPMALEIVKKCMEHATASDLMFPSPDIDCMDSPITQSCLNQSVIRQKRLGIEVSWSPHDLRRSASTGMSKLKILQDTINQVLAHSMNPLAKIYNRDDFVETRLEALTKWNDHIAKIVNGPEPKKKGETVQSDA